MGSQNETAEALQTALLGQKKNDDIIGTLSSELQNLKASVKGTNFFECIYSI